MSGGIPLLLVAFMACAGTTLNLHLQFIIIIIIIITLNEWGGGGGIYVTFRNLPEITEESCEAV
jgi:hypothetical protein